MQRPEHPEDRQGLPADIQRILSYIEENALDPELNVQRIKLHCRLRDNNVSSRFRFFLGATIRDYLEARRMDAAAVLLRQNGATVMEVAFAVGYNNLQTFYGAFRRKYSCTPDTYRRRFHDPVVREDLGRLAQPSEIELRTTLPRTRSGKIVPRPYPNPVPLPEDDGKGMIEPKPPALLRRRPIRARAR